MSTADASPAIAMTGPTVPVVEHRNPIEYDNPQHVKWTPVARKLMLPAQTESHLTRAFTSLFAIVVAGLYLFLLLAFWAPAHPGVDQNGYFVGGRMFAETFSTGITQKNDFEFIGRMWIMVDSGENFPKYPLGLPILFATCIWLQPLWNYVNWDGHDVAHLISPVSAAMATLGMFFFVRRLSGSFAGLLAMMMLALSQVMLTLAINPNSHALGTCLTVWGFYLMVRWLETGALWRGMLCAFLLGYAFLVRYTEGLQLLPLGIAMLYAAIWNRPGWIRTLATVGGVILFVVIASIVGKMSYASAVASSAWYKPLAEQSGTPYKVLIGSIALAALVSLFVQPRSLWRLLLIGSAWLVPVLYQTIFNMVEMGSFTSYAGTNESTGFHRDYFVVNWEKMVRVIHDQGLFFIAPIGLIGLVLMFRRLPMVATILALWFLPSVLLYTAYYWAPDQWGVSYSRFVLTELPALIVPAAWLMARLIHEPSRRVVSSTSSDGLSVTEDESPRPLRHGMWLPILGAVLIAISASLLMAATLRYAPTRDAIWWALAGPLVIVGVIGFALLAGINDRGARWLSTQLYGSVPRIAVGVAAFIACAIGGYRCVVGTEWGQRLNARANIEVQSFESKNLAQLGQAARRAIPREAVVFADGERLHHLQWLSQWVMFPADGFNPEIVRRLLWRTAPDENDPDPIDPGRLRFLRNAYDKKDQKALTAEQNAIVENALSTGVPVFAVLSERVAKDFLRKFIETGPVAERKFTATLKDVVVDTVMPRRPEDFLLPSERPKMPVGRGGRPMTLASNTGQSATTWQIIEITRRPAPPATQPDAVVKTDVAVETDAAQP